MAGSTPTTTPITLPILNISDPNDVAVGKAMLDAAAKFGFLYVDTQGSGFGVDDVEGAFGLSKKFFASPTDEKDSCTIQPNNRGWSRMHAETLDPEHHQTGDFKEAMNFGEFQNGKAQQPLPSSLAPHEAEINHFTNLCNQACTRILKLLALGLGIEPTFFTTRHDPGLGPTGSILRYLYYPSLTSPSTKTYKEGTDLRAGAHSDYGSITLLFQRAGQPGLEILTPDGTWAPVPVTPAGHTSTPFEFPPILVNIGDLLSYWTDGLLKSTVHRVVFPESEQEGERENDRYSIVFFCQPLDSTELVPVPSRVVEEFRVRNEGREKGVVGFGGGAGSWKTGERALTAKEHLEARLTATYGIKMEG